MKKTALLKELVTELFIWSLQVVSILMKWLVGPLYVCFLQSALVESDSHRDELESKTRILEGQVVDLQEQLAQHTVTDEQVVKLVHARAKEWEVR